MPQGDVNRIREYATGLVEQARREGRESITIRAGNVHKALGLRQAYANVGQALDGEIFHRQARVKLVDYDGPPSRRGSKSEFIYRILHGREQGDDWRRRVPQRPTRREQASDLRERLREFPTQHEQANDWRKRVLELPIEGFQELFSDYLKAKGFSNAEVEIVIRMRGLG